MIELSNEKTYIRIEEKEIFGRDKTDRNNEPSFFNTTKRGLKKACKDIQARFTEETTMRDVMNILREHRVRYHYYCAMD